MGDETSQAELLIQACKRIAASHALQDLAEQVIASIAAASQDENARKAALQIKWMRERGLPVDADTAKRLLGL